MAAAQSPRSNGWTNRDYSPRRQHMDAQRQQVDLEQAFNDLRIRDAEVKKLHELNRRIQNEEADLKENSLAKIHQAALENSKRERDSLRQQAEAVLQQHLREEEDRRRREEERERQRVQREAEAREAQERAKREEEERIKLEQERIRADAEAKAKAERQRQEELKAETERLERERKENEQKQQQQAREQKEREDAARIEAATNAQRKAREDSQAASAAPTAAKFTPSTTAGTRSDSSAEEEHKEYIELYLKLKKWMNAYWEKVRSEAKKPGQRELKNAISEARSVIKAELGKLSTADKEVNQVAENKLKTSLLGVHKSVTPIIGEELPVNFFLPPSLSLNDGDQTRITDQAAYFLCFFVKIICQYFMTSIADQPRRSEPHGTLITKIFGHPDLQYARQGANVPASQKSQSLIPILIAKYHRVCPGLFGITATQKSSDGKLTSEGKRKLGWALAPSPDDSPKNTLIDEQTQMGRWTGLANGYAAFALRNASTSRMITNPYPPKYFWKSLAQLTNLPPEHVQPVHLLLLQNMFGHDGIKRFLLFFGDVGIAALREAYVQFLGRLPAKIREDILYKQAVIFANDKLPKLENEALHLT